jgi:hypothetical protein
MEETPLSRGVCFKTSSLMGRKFGADAPMFRQTLYLFKIHVPVLIDPKLLSDHHLVILIFQKRNTLLVL